MPAGAGPFRTPRRGSISVYATRASGRRSSFYDAPRTGPAGVRRHGSTGSTQPSRRTSGATKNDIATLVGRASEAHMPSSYRNAHVVVEDLFSRTARSSTTFMPSAGAARTTATSYPRGAARDAKVRLLRHRGCGLDHARGRRESNHSRRPPSGGCARLCACTRCAIASRSRPRPSRGARGASGAVSISSGMTPIHDKCGLNAANASTRHAGGVGRAAEQGVRSGR